MSEKANQASLFNDLKGRSVFLDRWNDDKHSEPSVTFTIYNMKHEYFKAEMGIEPTKTHLPFDPPSKKPFLNGVLNLKWLICHIRESNPYDESWHSPNGGSRTPNLRVYSPVHYSYATLGIPWVGINPREHARFKPFNYLPCSLVMKTKCQRQDSNLRRGGLQPPALPSELLWQ